MYKLQFLEKKSKNFPKALKMARKIGCNYEDGVITIEIKDILNGYRKIRQLFHYIQNWRGTSATYNNRPVHPYRFLLEAEWIGECYDQRMIDNDCGTGFGCRKVDTINYHITGPYFKTHTYWYNYGEWKASKWIIDKKKIYNLLIAYAEKKAISECPLFDETDLWNRVQNLPEFLIADGILWETVYEESFVKGERIQVPHNIKHRYPDKLKGTRFCLLDY